MSVPHIQRRVGALRLLTSLVRVRTTSLRGLLILLIAVWAASCETHVEYETAFEVPLKGVERSSAAGAVTAIPVAERSSANRARGYTVDQFTDGGLEVEVDFLSSQIQFAIHNRSGTPATIAWDRLVYVDADRNEHHGFSPRPKSRSAIGPGERLHVLGAPTDFTAPVENGLAVTGILRPPPSIDPVLQDSREQYCSQIGKSLTLRLPVRMNDELRTYSMHFEITDIVVIEFRSGISGKRERWLGCS